MPISRNYKAGAIIFFEGDQKSDEIYVMKSGAVTLTYRDIETLSYVSEKLKIGDFFGVKSALSRQGKQETARALENSVLLVLSTKEFEDLVVKKTELVLKMLKIYSSQLRKIEKKASELVSTSGYEKPEPEKSLFQIAQHYFDVQKWNEAIYVGKKYIQHYPNGDYNNSLEEIVSLSEQQRGSVSGGEELEKDSAKEYELEGKEGTVQGDIEKDIEKKIQDGSVRDMPSDDSVEGFLSEGSESSGEEFSASVTPRSSYEEIQTQMESGHYESVLKAIRSLDNWNDLDTEKKENLHFFQGRSYFEVENYEKALESLTEFAKRYPRTSQLRESLFYMGVSHKKLGNEALSKSFLEKVLKLKEEDSLAERAKKYLDTE